MTKRGLYRKYVVEKVDGRPVDPDAEYFVLRVDKDPAARAAVLAYARACREANQGLSDDLCAWVKRFASEGEADPDGATLAAYREVLENLSAVMDNSEGVTGWHLNGDVATWDEFEETGQIVSLLASPDPGQAVVEQLKAGQALILALDYYLSTKKTWDNGSHALRALQAALTAYKAAGLEG